MKEYDIFVSSMRQLMCSKGRSATKLDRLVTSCQVARSVAVRSGFLIAATDKAKRGELDVRGFGAIDPWKATLEALKSAVGGTKL